MHLWDYSTVASNGALLMCRLMCWCRAIVPLTGHNGELHVKQETQADFAAMSRDHVTEEDIETFTRVQELAAQVGKRYKRSGFFAHFTCLQENWKENQSGIIYTKKVFQW